MSAGAEFLARLEAAARQAAQQSPVVKLSLRAAGLPVRVRLAGEELIAGLAPGLLSVDGDDDPVAELWAFDAAGSGISAPRPPWGPGDYLQREEIAGWTEPPRLAAYDVAHATLSVADVDVGVGVQWMRDARGMAPWEGGSPLRSLLRWTLAAHGVHLLHAAAVGTADGGVLLAGPGGSGKSTSALACLQAGMCFVADDYCLVRTGPEPTAHPAFAIAKAGAHSLQLVGGLEDRVRGAVVDWRGKRRLPIGDVVADALALQAVVLPRVAPRTGRPVALDPHEAMRELAVSTLFQLPGHGGATLGALRELLGALPVYRLDVGPDVEAIPEALAGLLRRRAAA